jgi:hypothetical protein
MTLGCFDPRLFFQLPVRFDVGLRQVLELAKTHESLVADIPLGYLLGS